MTKRTDPWDAVGLMFAAIAENTQKMILAGKTHDKCISNIVELTCDLSDLLEELGVNIDKELVKGLRKDTADRRDNKA